MRRVNQWLDGLRWWQFAALYFPVMTALFSAGSYIAAWSTGGVAPYDMGFNGAGELNLPGIALAAGVFTTGSVLVRAWRHRHARRSAHPQASPTADPRL